MGLFRRARSDEDVVAQFQFDKEWHQAVLRFGVVTGVGDMHVNLKHPETGELMTPHAGLEGLFDAWKQIKAEYDRRAVLAEQMLEYTEKSMSPWQLANYLVADRRPNEALEMLSRAQPPGSQEEDFAPYCGACAKSLLGLTQYPEALPWAEKASSAAPASNHFRTVLADALHLAGRVDDAHAIYSELMSQAGGSTDAELAGIKEVFASLFAVETGVVSSPVLAVEIGRGLADPAQSQEFWRRAETEFIYSPYFRMQHAYELTKKGDTNRALAKLIALVQEMPWVKEASLNLVIYFERLDPEGKLMPEFQEQLRKQVQENGWTVEGMHEMRLAWGKEAEPG